MKIYPFMARCCSTLILVLLINSATTSLETPVANSEGLPVQPAERRAINARDKLQYIDQEQITKEKAIAIANEEAIKSYPSLDSFRVVACEQNRLWVVIYDGGGPEYYLDKISGAILAAQLLETNGNGESSASTPNTGLGSSEAIEIAKKDFVNFLLLNGDVTDQINEYDVFACELNNAWRVFFEYHADANKDVATLPNSNPPSYLIDKTSGKINFTTHPLP